LQSYRIIPLLSLVVSRHEIAIQPDTNISQHK